MGSCGQSRSSLFPMSSEGESGLMSVALHPQFAANHLLYLSYAYNTAANSCA